MIFYYSNCNFLPCQILIDCESRLQNTKCPKHLRKLKNDFFNIELYISFLPSTPGNESLSSSEKNMENVGKVGNFE